MSGFVLEVKNDKMKMFINVYCLALGLSFTEEDKVKMKSIHPGQPLPARHLGGDRGDWPHRLGEGQTWEENKQNTGFNAGAESLTSDSIKTQSRPRPVPASSKVTVERGDRSKVTM